MMPNQFFLLANSPFMPVCYPPGKRLQPGIVAYDLQFHKTAENYEFFQTIEKIRKMPEI